MSGDDESECTIYYTPTRYEVAAGSTTGMVDGPLQLMVISTLAPAPMMYLMRAAARGYQTYLLTSRHLRCCFKTFMLAHGN